MQTNPCKPQLQLDGALGTWSCFFSLRPIRVSAVVEAPCASTLGSLSSLPLIHIFHCHHLDTNTMHIFTILAYLLASCTAHNITSRIVDAAIANGIELYSLPFAAQALFSIQDIYNLENISLPPGITNGKKFDVHMHVVPPWYRAAVPSVGGFPTPNWTLETHLSFMAGANIRHGVLSMGTPGSVVYPGSQVKSVAIARLLNEYLAAVWFTCLVSHR